MAYSFDDYLESNGKGETDDSTESESGKKSGWLSFDEYIAQRKAKRTTEEVTSAASYSAPQTLKQHQQKNREQLLLGNGVGSSVQNRAEK